MGTESSERIIEPNNALQKPSTLNPGAAHPASIRSRAFTTSVKSPSVRKFIGRVINIKTGFIKVFIKPIIILTKSAAQKLLTLIPGIIHATKTIASENKIHLTNKFIQKSPFVLILYEFFDD